MKIKIENKQFVLSLFYYLFKMYALALFIASIVIFRNHDYNIKKIIIYASVLMFLYVIKKRINKIIFDTKSNVMTIYYYSWFGLIRKEKKIEVFSIKYDKNKIIINDSLSLSISDFLGVSKEKILSFIKMIETSE